MVVSGDTIHSPATGETFTFLQTAAKTKGRLLQMEMCVSPGGGAKAVPIHIHPKHEERFFIHAGRIAFLLDGCTRIYRPGETVIASPGTPHTWRNAGEDELRFIVEIEPAGHFERLFESMCNLSSAGKMSKSGRVNPLMLAIALNKYPDHMYVAGLPVRVAKTFVCSDGCSWAAAHE